LKLTDEKQLWLLAEPFYFICSGLTKVSVGLFLLRVVAKKIHIWILYAAMAVSAISSIFLLFFMVFQCSPISYFWNRSQPKGHCLSPTVITNATYAFSAISGVCDFTLGILPIFVVWHLKMNRQTKWAVAILLSMAAMSVPSHPLLGPTVHLQSYSASSATIVRLPYIKSLSESKDPFCMDCFPLSLY
jgi:hypothetical protein